MRKFMELISSLKTSKHHILFCNIFAKAILKEVMKYSYQKLQIIFMNMSNSSNQIDMRISRIILLNSTAQIVNKYNILIEKKIYKEDIIL